MHASSLAGIACDWFPFTASRSRFRWLCIEILAGVLRDERWRKQAKLLLAELAIKDRSSALNQSQIYAIGKSLHSTLSMWQVSYRRPLPPPPLNLQIAIQDSTSSAVCYLCCDCVCGSATL